MKDRQCSCDCELLYVNFTQELAAKIYAKYSYFWIFLNLNKNNLIMRKAGKRSLLKYKGKTQIIFEMFQL